MKRVTYRDKWEEPSPSTFFCHTRSYIVVKIGKLYLYWKEVIN
ncbi:MAG: hypothetical protein RXR08_10860 [Sulfolobaceae archaeon]